MGGLRSEAQLHTCPQFLPEFPIYAFSSQDPPRSSRRKVAPQKPFDFSQKNYRLTKRFPHVLHRLFHPSKERQLGKSNFHLR